MSVNANDIIEIIKVSGAVAGTVLAGAAAVATAASPLVVKFAPVLDAYIRRRLAEEASAETQAAFASFEAAVKPAVSAAADAYRTALAKAAMPDSEGGTAVVQAEYDQALAAGVEAGIAALTSQGVIGAVTRAVGGDAVLRASFAAKVRRDLAIKHDVRRQRYAVI